MSQNPSLFLTMIYDNLTKAQKKRINVKNIPGNLPIDLCWNEDDLPPMPPLEDDEEVKLEPEETIAKRAKLNPWNKLLTVFQYY